MPGTNFENDTDGYDPQDQSEAFDETNFTDGGDAGEVRSYAEAAEGRTFEDLPEVEDLTRADGDADDDEALALDADEFDPEAIGDADLEEDDELDYRAATEERQADLDGLGPEDNFAEDLIPRSDIDGLGEVRDASEAQGGEDDFTDFEAKGLDDDDLNTLGYGKGADRK